MERFILSIRYTIKFGAFCNAPNFLFYKAFLEFQKLYFIENQYFKFIFRMDLCMCTGGDCPQRQQCLRFTGEILGRQDFFGMPPYLQSSKQCPYFLRDKSTQEAIRQKAYLLWQQAGCPNGNDLLYWLQAEGLINAFPEQ